MVSILSEGVPFSDIYTHLSAFYRPCITITIQPLFTFLYFTGVSDRLESSTKDGNLPGRKHLVYLLIEGNRGFRGFQDRRDWMKLWSFTR